MQAQNHDGETRQEGLETDMVVTNEFKQVTPLEAHTGKEEPRRALIDERQSQRQDLQKR